MSKHPFISVIFSVIFAAVSNAFGYAVYCPSGYTTYFNDTTGVATSMSDPDGTTSYYNSDASAINARKQDGSITSSNGSTGKTTYYDPSTGKAISAKNADGTITYYDSDGNPVTSDIAGADSCSQASQTLDPLGPCNSGQTAPSTAALDAEVLSLQAPGTPFSAQASAPGGSGSGNLTSGSTN